MSIKRLRELAQIEKAAEVSRARAEEKWRRAWWETTLGLGAVENTKGDRMKAYDAVCAETGQDRAWVRRRAVVGTVFRMREHTEIAALPPRLTVQVVSMAGGQRRDPDELIAEIKSQEGRSLREASRELTGRRWADEPDSSVSRATPTAIAKEVERRPEVRRAIVENDRAYLPLREERAGIDTSTAGRKAAQARGHAVSTPARRSAALMTVDLIVSHLNGATDELTDYLESGEVTTPGMDRIREAYDRFSEKLVVGEATVELRS